MNTQEMKEHIKRIIHTEYGVSAFAVIKKDDAFSLKKFILDDALNSKVSSMLKTVLENQFLCDSAKLDRAENIDDDRKVFYEIPQTAEYSPFDFLKKKLQNPLLLYLFHISTNLVVPQMLETAHQRTAEILI